MRPLVPKGILSVRQTGIGHSSFSSGVSSFGLELIFETIIPVQVTTTTQRYIPIPNAHVKLAFELSFIMPLFFSATL